MNAIFKNIKSPLFQTEKTLIIKKYSLKYHLKKSLKSKKNSLKNKDISHETKHDGRNEIGGEYDFYTEEKNHSNFLLRHSLKNSKFNFSPKLGSETIRKVGQPYNVQHLIHVDKNYEWLVQNLEATFVLKEN
eukprot:TRINITY_DN3308_c0_g1_i1.p1 TRINITY_DN3308_c0_g1~~TRINITY_DN3308_c0_g1_i1.p1  ORF type:complete len:132 (+),score=15.11 TRINITY_DN3308_c0_g1_i1:208-603(+)